MQTSDIPAMRLQNHRLSGNTLENPSDVVTWLGAVQSQDYTGAKWALGMRLAGVSDAEVDHAFNSGSILRTHVMRPTWHFLTPADIRWMLALTGPRVHAVNGYYYRQLELDAALLARSNETLRKALGGGNHLTRQELGDVLRRAGIATATPSNNTLRLGYMIIHAELDGVLCSGPKKGKQFTYALLDERVPRARNLERDEALAELTLRYFTSHGPATIKDFTWWSGLTAADARAGLDMVRSRVVSETLDGRTYWFPPYASSPREEGVVAYLLPNYDEYIVAYADHSVVLDPAHSEKLELLFPHSIVVGGQVVGGWKRVIKRDAVEVVTKLFTPLNSEQEDALARAANDYSRFLGVPVTVS